MHCPSSNQFLAFVEGQLQASQAQAMEEHLDRCSDCRQVMAALGSLSRSSLNAKNHASAAPFDSALCVGARVDQYAILELLGRGGMGDVYLAKDLTLDRKVAIKTVRTARVHEQGVARILREARTTARFSHPNIVSIYGVGQVDDLPYLVLEYVPGQTLRQRMSAGRLNRQERCAVALAIAQALAEAHRACVMHGDLKPSNVLISQDGRVRVLDFGLARTMRDLGSTDPSIPSLSDGSIAAIQGTPRYMAPEQWHAGATTLASDVWALGTVLFEAAVGHPPFPPAAVASGQISLPRAVAESRADLSADELALLSACFQLDPAARPSAEQVVESLREAGADERHAPKMVSAPSTVPDASAGLSSHTRLRPKLIAVWVGVACLAVIGVAWGVQAFRPSSSPSFPSSSGVASPLNAVSSSSAPVAMPSESAQLVAPNASTSGDQPIVSAPKPPAVAVRSVAAVAHASASAAAAGSSPPSMPLRLDALAHMEDFAERLDRQSLSEPDPQRATLTKENARNVRRDCDQHLSEVEARAWRGGVDSQESARLLEYVKQARAYLTKRRAKSRP